MKLINDIINELIDVEKPISSPLLKTKVLASRLQNKILLDWVSNELSGYEDLDNLPHYRITRGTITGTYINGQMQYNDQPVPTIGLNQQWEDVIQNVYLSQSVSSIENQIKEGKSGRLEYSFPAELVGIIQQNWRKMGNPYLQLINCKKTISLNTLNEILSFVRNNLLDFMLKIDEEFGNITEIEELKTKHKQITHIMNKTIITNTGDGNVVNTGNDTKISATITINKGNKDELSKYLQDVGISQSDTEELVAIIDSEEPDKENRTFGKKVNNWIQKMIGKALDNSWNIGIGAAGSILGEAIMRYYGM